MTQLGTLIGLALCLALGCADSESSEPNDVGGQGSAAGGGIGGGGVGGNAGGAGGTGGDAAQQACMNLPQPGVYARVQSDRIPGAGAFEVDITGSVERAETGASAGVNHAGSRAFGNVSAGLEQGYVIRDGETEIGLTLRTGSARPLLTGGQRVHVAVEGIPSGHLLLSDTFVLSVRDEADGRLLYWFAQTDLGLEQLALPEGFTAANAEPECMHDWDCGVNVRRGLALQSGSEEVALEIGQLGNIGELAAILFDNSEVVLGGNGICFDISAHERVSVALIARELVSKCDWLDESACASTDDCRDVHAYIASNNDPAAGFVACVADDSCGDGDPPTCALNDATELPGRFTTTCVPPGWTAVADGACDADVDGGSQ